MIIAVADAGPIIHLGEVDALRSLSTIDRVLISEPVSEELEGGTVLPALSDIESELVETDAPTLSGPCHVSQRPATHASPSPTQSLE